MTETAVRKLSTTIEWLLESNLACLGFIFVCCFLIFGFPLLFGLPSGYDMLTDIRFATVFRDAMANGQIFPGWANDNFGFGSIGVRFYPPIAFYVLALAEMITASWFSALWLSLVFWMFVGCGGVFLFVKEFSSPYQGLIAGILYAVVPQHLNEIFQFFLFAEFAAWGVLPFCFWFLTRVCRGGSWLDTVMFAIAYALLVLTHLPTTIIASFCFPIYVLALLDRRTVRSTFAKLAGAIALTAAATSFRWVNLLSEFHWVSHNSNKWATGYYQYSAWFFPNVLHERGQFIYVLTSTLFDISILMTMALTIPGLIYLVVRRTERSVLQWRIVAAVIGTAAFAFFMLSQPSKFVWDNLTFLQKMQFPWRWLSVASLLSVTAFAVALPRLLELFRSRERLIAYPALALVFAIILFDITQIVIPSDPIPSAKFDKVEKKLATEALFEGWWPTWAKSSAMDASAVADESGRSVELVEDDWTSKTFVIQAGSATTVSLPIFYYPHWKATIDSAPVDVNPDPHGLLNLAVPAGTAEIRIVFQEPTRHLVANWVSLAAWALVVLFLLRRQLSAILRLAKPLRIPSERFDFS